MLPPGNVMTLPPFYAVFSTLLPRRRLNTHQGETTARFANGAIHYTDKEIK